MRQEDKKAFVEEYLELCRKYGVAIFVCGDYASCLVLDEYFNEYDNDIKGMAE